MDDSKILEQMCVKTPEWLKHHDHLSTIPFTRSFVFYPYNENESGELYLNSYYNKFGYTVITRPKNESEYNCLQHQTIKVLILELNYDQQKIDEGCNLIKQYYRGYWKKINSDVGEF